MKTLLSLLGFLLFAALLSPARAAEDASSPESTINDILALFEKNKYDEAISKLDEADKQFPKNAIILNLLGAAYTKKKDFAKATVYFNEALDIDYSFFPAHFNLGEIYFLQGQYPKALDYFSRMLRNNPDNELLQFKVVLCLLQTDQLEDAKKLASRMKFPGQEPAWYFAQAAIAVKEGKKGEASKYISGAETLFSGKTSLYRETFQDLGWPTR